MSAGVTKITTITVISCWPFTGHMLLGLNVSTCMCVSVQKFVLNMGAINHVSYVYSCASHPCIDYVDLLLIV